MVSHRDSQSANVPGPGLSWKYDRFSSLRVDCVHDVSLEISGSFENFCGRTQVYTMPWLVVYYQTVKLFQYQW
jgi:hypothetical protein